MKKEYMKPVIRVVMLQQQHVICTSPGGHDEQKIPTFWEEGEEPIDDEGLVW